MSNRKTKKKNSDSFYVGIYDFIYSHWISKSELWNYPDKENIQLVYDSNSSK